MERLLTTLDAVSEGDFSVRLPASWTGLEGKVAESLNSICARLERFNTSLLRLRKRVGEEGKIGERLTMGDSVGGWAERVEAINALVDELSQPTVEMGRVIGAVAKGDLSQSMPLELDGRPLRGEYLRTAKLVNGMVGQLGAFSVEVIRVAREVGTEGKLGGQAQVRGVSGVWKELTESVNQMAGNLTAQVRNIADVTIAVANGDLSKKITVDVRGEILQLKEAINVMVDQLRSFAAEVTRVARDVGTEGKLGGQAVVPGVSGTWKDLTDSVNAMASNLTAQVRNIAGVTTAVARGDLSRKITVDVKGEILELKETINTMVDRLNAFASEVSRVAREVGTEGKLGGQAVVPGVAGTWKDLTDSVNSMAGNLTGQVRNIAEVATAIANGDLSRKITVDVRGEILLLKETLNTMVDQLNAFAGEVTRVAREVGTEGRLGGQANVPGVGGTWKDLTDNVNVMAANLTEQVRGIVKVVTAVANGDLKQNLTVASKGEVAALAETINNMTNTLATFADQVTTVAREVGVEGKLGGQARVPGASGTWKDLTDNVNLLAANLTTQVRAIAEVATAVTKGDLTRSIQVDARGEVAELKDNINTMIGNLRLTTDRNTEQDWLKTNLARFTNMLQGQRDLATVGRMLLSDLAPLVDAQHGVIYQVESEGPTPGLKLLSAYADGPVGRHLERLQMGEGLIGQCARDARRMLITEMPPSVAPIGSGLFKAPPRNAIVLPVLFEGQVKAVIELASLGAFTDLQMSFLEQLTTSIGIVLNSIEATMQTEGLLKQSQQLATELQSQQRELQQTNEQLEQKAQQLAERNVEVERKNQEIDQARRAVEEKAAELALTSKYKSEFLANMSHE
ncbi:MAG TPA: HAMP domain-containing protein, partial [Candidatus Synoicihabitans sp.]|nr:HAMP domain-containing protein [Candidatus Synoicihabitans sp.]